MKKTIIFTIISLLLLAACGTQVETTPTKQKEPVKIGVSLPLTGEAVSWGSGAVAGIDMAVKEINDAGGINGRPIKIIYEDDKCIKDGVTTLTKLVNADKVNAIIGPVCSAAAGPGLPVVQESGTPAIIYGSAPHLTKIGNFIFRIYPSDTFAGKFMAEYVFNNMNKRNIALVYVKNDWGQGIRDTFVERFAELGGNVVFDESLNQDEKDAKTVITKLKASNPEVIVAPLYPAVGLVFVKQVTELGVDLPILGGDAFETDEFIQSGVADGIKYTVAKINNPEEFQEKISQEGGDLHLMNSLGYDAVKLLAHVMEEVGTDKKAVRDALAKVQFQGISTSIIEFDENGDLKAASYDVKIIKDNKSEVVN